MVGSTGKLGALCLVVTEASGGDADAAARRIQLLHGIAHLAVTPDVETLVEHS
jgi:hypothetical protein